MISIAIAIFALVLVGAAGAGNFASGMFCELRPPFWRLMGTACDMLGMCAVILGFIAGRLA